jgi:hypothetical protein
MIGTNPLHPGPPCKCCCLSLGAEPYTGARIMLCQGTFAVPVNPVPSCHHEPIESPTQGIKKKFHSMDRKDQNYFSQWFCCLSRRFIFCDTSRHDVTTEEHSSQLRRLSDWQNHPQNMNSTCTMRIWLSETVY